MQSAPARTGRGQRRGQVAQGAVIPRDQLSREELAREYGFALNVIYSVPELRDLFEEAFRAGGLTPDAFAARVQSTNWYRTNDVYARNAWAQEMVGGADWQTALQNAKNQVKKRATQVGADLTGPELDALSRRFLYEGWGEAARQGMLDEALSQDISFLPDERGGQFRGMAGTLVDRLREIANANGIRFSDSWYESEAKSVVGGLSTEDDALRKVREQAASRWGQWGEQIRSGRNMYELASPYLNMMEDTLELPSGSVRLDDPFISRALTGQDGTPLPLWEFQMQLRKDPRWMNTNFAQNEITGVADAVMKMFGLRG
jgi:hypothetical protein